ncbi:hypothetical protein [Arcobacter sp. YIC-310]|uniref:hypothetical protein n=1 Tax=Arcobacter sp. YIC-310 TaxID=3376632 RepID=UPI003C1DDB76
MQDKMKKIFQYLLIVYVVFGLTQATNKYHVANLLYKEDAKILTEFNRWSKVEENQDEINKILKGEEETKKDSSTPKFVTSNTKDKEHRTSDNKYSYSEVRKYHEDVKGFNKINSFIFNMNTINFTIVLYLVFKFFRRRRF